MEQQLPRPPSFEQNADFWLTLTKAMLGTLDLEQILYVILSGITAGDGLNFNRAFLLLRETGDTPNQIKYQSRLAIGPHSAAAAHRIWEALEKQDFQLEDLMQNYQRFIKDPEASRLSRQFRKVSVCEETTPSTPFTKFVHQALNTPLLHNEQLVPIDNARLSLYHFAMAPLIAKNEVIGLLIVDNAYNARPIHDSELETLSVVANLAAIAVKQAKIYERIQQMAVTDALTQLASRYEFEPRASALFQKAQREHHSFSILQADIDRFRDFNEQHGRLAGDLVLQTLGLMARTHCWGDAFGVRFRGDEILLILPKTPKEEAFALAEQLRRQFAEYTFPNEQQLTLTIGIASHTQHPSLHALLEEAEQALQQAKKDGRNRVKAIPTPRQNP